MHKVSNHGQLSVVKLDWMVRSR